jgi:hypothetical protein
MHEVTYAVWCATTCAISWPSTAAMPFSSSQSGRIPVKTNTFPLPIRQHLASYFGPYTVPWCNEGIYLRAINNVDFPVHIVQPCSLCKRYQPLKHFLHLLHARIPVRQYLSLVLLLYFSDCCGAYPGFDLRADDVEAAAP